MENGMFQGAGVAEFSSGMAASEVDHCSTPRSCLKPVLNMSRHSLGDLNPH